MGLRINSMRNTYSTLELQRTQFLLNPNICDENICVAGENFKENGFPFPLPDHQRKSEIRKEGKLIEAAQFVLLSLARGRGMKKDLSSLSSLREINK